MTDSLRRLPIPIAASEIEDRGWMPDRSVEAFKAWHSGRAWQFHFKCGGVKGPSHRLVVHPDGRAEFPDHAEDTTATVLSTIARTGEDKAMTCPKLQAALDRAFKDSYGSDPEASSGPRSAGDALRSFVRGRGTVGRILGPILYHVTSRGCPLVPPPYWREAGLRPAPRPQQARGTGRADGSPKTGRTEERESEP